MRRKIIEVEKLNKEILQNTISYIQTCENDYKSQIKKVIDYLVENKEIKFVLLAGPSSSGKTTTAKLLKENLEKIGYNAKTISLDDFFVERVDTPLWENGKPNYESVDAIDWKLFDKCTHELLTKHKSLMPTYNFITGNKEFNEIATLGKNDIIIIEGLHSLNSIIDNFIETKYSVKIYISPYVRYVKNSKVLIDETKLRFFRRLIRDVYTRGATPIKTLNEWNDVRLGEKLYINPFKKTAKFFINSVHPYEICIYKEILKELKVFENKKFNRKLKVFENFAPLKKSNMPKDSLLQEFIH